MPKNPDRPKIKYKRVRRPPPVRKTREQIRDANIKKLEARHKLSPYVVATMLLKYRGLISSVARAMKVPRQTLTRYIEKQPDCIEAMDHAREAMGDMAEKKLHELIEAGDVRCILFYLSTIHKHRGYALRPEDQSAADTNGRGPVYVETVNIVGIPSGTFLPKDIAAKDNMVIENR